MARRKKEPKPFLGRLKLGPIVFDLDKLTLQNVEPDVFGNYNMPTKLTPQEFSIVVYLARQSGNFISKEMMMDFLYVHQGKREPELKILDVLLCKIRKKITPTVGPGWIETMWGRGWTIEKPKGSRGIKALPAIVAEAA